MGTSLATVGRKGAAVAILLGGAYLLFKLALGLVSTLLWLVVGVVAVMAIIWAIRVL